MNVSIKRFFVTAALLLITSLAFAYNGPTAQSAAIDGEKVTIEGTLAYDGPALEIKTASDTYEVAAGNRRYLSSLEINLDQGAELIIFGFVDDGVVTPIIMIQDGEAFFLRDTDGSPLWPNRRSPSVAETAL